MGPNGLFVTDMNEPKHSKGPWYVTHYKWRKTPHGRSGFPPNAPGPGRVRIEICREDGGLEDVVAEIVRRRDQVGINPKEWLSNAYLLAAAPDLYASLAELVAFCDDPDGSEKPESLADGLARMLPAARKAITKAGEGGVLVSPANQVSSRRKVTHGRRINPTFTTSAMTAERDSTGQSGHRSAGSAGIPGWKRARRQQKEPVFFPPRNTLWIS